MLGLGGVGAGEALAPQRAIPSQHVESCSRVGQDLDGTSQDGQVTKRRLRAQQPGRWSETFASETAPSASQAGDPPDFSRIQSGAGIACRAPVTSNRSIACCYSRGLVSAQLSDAVVEWALAAVGGDRLVSTRGLRADGPPWLLSYEASGTERKVVLRAEAKRPVNENTGVWDRTCSRRRNSGRWCNRQRCRQARPPYCRWSTSTGTSVSASPTRQRTAWPPSVGIAARIGAVDPGSADLPAVTPDPGDDFDGLRARTHRRLSLVAAQRHARLSRQMTRSGSCMATCRAATHSGVAAAYPRHRLRLRRTRGRGRRSRLAYAATQLCATGSTRLTRFSTAGRPRQAGRLSRARLGMLWRRSARHPTSTGSFEGIAGMTGRPGPPHQGGLPRASRRIPSQRSRPHCLTLPPTRGPNGSQISALITPRPMLPPGHTESALRSGCAPCNTAPANCIGRATERGGGAAGPIERLGRPARLPQRARAKGSRQLPATSSHRPPPQSPINSPIHLPSSTCRPTPHGHQPISPVAIKQLSPISPNLRTTPLPKWLPPHPLETPHSVTPVHKSLLQFLLPVHHR